MSFAECSICGSNDFLDKHDCGEKYVIFHEYTGVEGEVRYGHSAFEAVEKWAVTFNEDGDFALMNTSVVVEVQKEGSDKKRKVRVGAVPSVNYSINFLD